MDETIREHFSVQIDEVVVKYNYKIRLESEYPPVYKLVLFACFVYVAQLLKLFFLHVLKMHSRICFVGVSNATWSVYLDISNELWKSSF